MAEVITRAKMRDLVRINMELIPPVYMNVPGAEEGQTPSYAPWPNNRVLNDNSAKALSQINAKTGFSTFSTQISVSVTAQTDEGPYYFNLHDVIPNITNQSVNVVHSAAWLESGGSTHTPLTPISRPGLDVDGANWRDTAVGTPRWYWIEGYKFYVLPGPSAAGAIKFNAEITSGSPLADNQTVLQMPADYQNLWVDWTTMLTCQQNMSNPLLREKYEVFRPQCADTLGDFIQAVKGNPTELEYRVTPITGRRYAGRRR